MAEQFYDIVPLTSIPLSKGPFFTYSSAAELQRGQVVSIPFGRSKVFGIVAGIPEKVSKRFPIKAIADVVSEEVMISEQQFSLAHYIADFYLAPLGLALDLMVPKIVSERSRGAVESVESDSAFEMNSGQQKAFAAISDSIQSENGDKFLLFGPTGSGKTEVYLQSAQKAVEAGKQVLVLVPEISLVPQNINRFKARFGAASVAILHSKISQGKKFTAWKNIHLGKAQIVIGPRSALFAPFKDLGLVIIDECHDDSFKQYDKNPRYSAVTLGEFLADEFAVPLILGSATPSVEQFYDAQSGIYQLLALDERIHQNAMPEVEVVDMREEFKKKNFSVFSESLERELTEVIENGRQALLFINRRGAASYVTCRSCGYVFECPDCLVSYTYHLYGKQKGLICHHCGKTAPVPHQCPECDSKAVKFLGGGTEKIEAALHSLLPGVRVARMDRDTTARRGAHEEIYTKFNAGEIDVLVGTQMISKGWDVSSVDLVGIVSADVGLHLPDFRSVERTFHTLTQVAGRTGRKDSQGKVVLQTYNPDNEVIQAVSKHDFLAFYETEIAIREELQYPPFTHIVKLTVRRKTESAAASNAKKLADKVASEFEQKNVSPRRMGPAPTFIAKVSNYYQYQIIYKVLEADYQTVKDVLKNVIDGDVKVDVDAVSML